MTRTKVFASIAGGLLAGVISSIPIIGWLWFIWAILGGLLAVFLLYRKVGGSIEIVDGLILGGAAGLIGAVVNLIGVLVFAAVGAAFSALMQTGSKDFFATFVTAFMFGLINVAINIIWSVLIFILALLSGLTLSAILRSTNSRPNPQPVNPFDTPGFK
ncbi:MAG: hypothetical protein ABI539_05015 [Acidobacteriota bacterium]